MRAYLKIWGDEYPVSSVWWRDSGEYAHVDLKSGEGKKYTVFHLEGEQEVIAPSEVIKQSLHTDLRGRIIWKEK